MKTGKNRKLLIFGIIASICMLSLTGCTVFDNFKAKFIDERTNGDKILYIGVLAAQTGDMSDKGKDEIKGIELAHSIYNNVSGYDVRLTVADTKSSTSGTASAIQALIKLNPTAIIGATGEASSLVASEYIEEAQIPAITPSCVNPLITQNNGYYFRACITDSQMGAGLSEYAYSVLAARNIAVISVKNDNTIAAVIDGFKDDLKLRAGSTSPIVYEDEIDITDEEYIDKLISNFKKKKIETAFLPVGVENADAFFTQIEKKGLTNIVFLGTKNWASKDFAKICENHPDIRVAFPSDNIIGENKSINNTVTPETRRFLIEYGNKYGSDETPTQYAALGYDAYLLIMNAIADARSPEHNEIRNAIASMKGIQCATGVFTFDERGNTIRTVNIASIENGQITTVYTTLDTSSAGQVKEIDGAKNTVNKESVDK